MPWEYLLMTEGYDEARRDRQRQEAAWLSLVLSAQTGKPITAAQLLGEAPAGKTDEQRAAEGARRVAEIQRKLKKAAKKKGK